MKEGADAIAREEENMATKKRRRRKLSTGRATPPSSGSTSLAGKRPLKSSGTCKTKFGRQPGLWQRRKAKATRGRCHAAQAAWKAQNCCAGDDLFSLKEQSLEERQRQDEDRGAEELKSLLPLHPVLPVALCCAGVCQVPGQSRAERRQRRGPWGDAPQRLP